MNNKEVKNVGMGEDYLKRLHCLKGEEKVKIRECKGGKGGGWLR